MLVILFRYSFAIVGINITGLTYQMLIAGHLKTHFYNVVQGQPQLEDFHKVYCKYPLCTQKHLLTHSHTYYKLI